MKKLAFLILLFPTTAFADRLAGLKADAQVLLSTQVTTSLTSGNTNYIQNTNSLQSGATAYPSFVHVGSSATVYGSLRTTGQVHSGTLSNVGGRSITSYAYTAQAAASGDFPFLHFSFNNVADGYFLIKHAGSSASTFIPQFAGLGTDTNPNNGHMIFSPVHKTGSGTDAAGKPSVLFQAFRSGDGFPDSGSAIQNADVAAFANFLTILLRIGTTGTVTNTPSAASTKGVVVRGAASHTANLIEGQNSASQILFSFSTMTLTLSDRYGIATSTISGTQIAISSTSKLGLWGAAPVVARSSFTVANGTTDRDFDADALTLDELADVVATLLDDLKTIGLHR